MDLFKQKEVCIVKEQFLNGPKSNKMTEVIQNLYWKLGMNILKNSK